MATIHDVAKLAGVSIASVSRCMNHSGYVSDETAKKIYEASQKLNYIPNIGMRLKRSNQTRIIALFIPTLKNSFFVELASNIDTYCLQNNYKLILCNIDEDSNKEASYLDMIARMKVDGVILATGTSLHLSTNQIPVVMLDRYSDSNNRASYVLTDNYNGAVLATTHLIQCGCKSLAFVQSIYQTYPQMLRLKGFHQTAMEYKIQANILIYENQEDIEAFDFSNYDGIFTWNDEIAIDVLFHLLKKGIHVPEQVKLIGFDDNLLSSRVYPSLSTISQDIPNLCKQTVDLLLKHIEKQEMESEKIIISPKLIVRKTTEVLHG